MNKLVEILKRTNCSLVVRDRGGHITTYRKPGVRDLEHLLDHEPAVLKGADVADKVTGKAAASMVAVGGIKRLYAEVMSVTAIPFLDKAGIAFSYGTLTNTIKEENNGRCQLEKITASAATPEEAVHLLRSHFAEMQKQKKNNTIMEKFSDIINNSPLTLVDFFATWCGPCKTMHPVLQQLKENLGNGIRILKIDVDQAQDFANAHSIQAVPTLMLFSYGKQLWRQSGAIGLADLEGVVNSYRK